MAASDIVIVSVLLFVFAIGGFTVFFAAHEVTNSLINMTAINSSSEAVTALQSTNEAGSRIDYLLLALFMGLSLGVIITGYLVGGHPIFMGAYFIVLVIAAVLSAVFGNVWSDVSGASIFGSAVTSFPITNHLLSNLVVYVSVIGVIGMIVMFFKPQEVGY